MATAFLFQTLLNIHRDSKTFERNKIIVILNTRSLDKLFNLNTTYL